MCLEYQKWKFLQPTHFFCLCTSQKLRNSQKPSRRLHYSFYVSEKAKHIIKI